MYYLCFTSYVLLCITYVLLTLLVIIQCPNIIQILSLHKKLKDYLEK